MTAALKGSGARADRVWIPCLGSHLGWAMKARETSLQWFTAGSRKPLLALAQAGSHFLNLGEILFQIRVGPPHITNSQDQPGCKSDIHMASTPSHKSHPVTWSWARSAPTCDWGETWTWFTESLWIQPMFWVCSKTSKAHQMPLVLRLIWTLLPESWCHLVVAACMSAHSTHLYFPNILRAVQCNSRSRE